MPILTKTADAYKLWHGFFQQFPRLSKYTLGSKIDFIFTELVELILLAGYANHEQKLTVIQKANTKLDKINFFLNIAWQLKMIDNKKYTAISPLLLEIGKMLGGWKKLFKKETPPMRFGGE